MTVSFDSEKASDKTQRPFLIKTVKKLGREGNLLSGKTSSAKKLTSYLTVRNQMLPQGRERGRGAPRHLHSPPYWRSGMPKTRKANETGTLWELRNKTVLVHRCHARLCRKPRGFTGDLPGRVSHRGKVAGYEVV